MTRHARGLPLLSLQDTPGQIAFAGFGVTYREAELAVELQRYRHRKWERLRGRIEAPWAPPKPGPERPVSSGTSAAIPAHLTLSEAAILDVLHEEGPQYEESFLPRPLGALRGWGAIERVPTGQGSMVRLTEVGGALQRRPRGPYTSVEARLREQNLARARRTA